MSRDPHLFDNIIDSISPTIYGLREVKAAVALQLFGGCHKVMDDGSVIRGDMHVLLVGDPGVAKSQLLRYMAQLSPRGIYASGKSASAAGLTATAVKDEDTGGWVLEAGALVLADGGLACIDELDKMTDQDRSSLHEAMESQRISVAKAGLTMALQCRCSMLAAANPKFGRFDTEGATIVSQIDLPPPLLSRFDLIFVLTDKPDEKYDRKVTQHILNVHRRGEARQFDGAEPPEGVDIEQIKESTVNIKPKYTIDQLRKYVAYAKQHIVPVMTDSAAKLIEDTYVRIRGSAEDGKTVPITARQLEAFVRIAEASAKMRLSSTVTDEDAQRAIDLVTYYLQRIAGTQGGGFDIDRMQSEYSSKDRADVSQIVRIVKAAGDDGMSAEDIIAAAAEDGVSEKEASQMIKKLQKNGTLYCPREGIYRVT
jgi:replicative DNA helicase Mcm